MMKADAFIPNCQQTWNIHNLAWPEAAAGSPDEHAQAWASALAES